jgi:3-oxoacyl-[acyl-carrier protein] reductase
MDLGLRDRVALVTGASKGIGRGIAAALVAEGAQVAISSRSAERIQATAAEIGARGYTFDAGDLDAIPALLERVQADLDAVPGVIAEVESALGPIDVYVANTGGPPAGPDPLAFSREQWEEAHRTLVLSPMAFIERLLPGMRERGWGRIVAVSSSAVREPLASIQLSNAHRPGLVAAFKVLAKQAAADGVTLNSVLPGRIATDRVFSTAGSAEAAEAAAREQVPAGRLGTVEEMAAAAVFLCSARASYITGTTLLVDGGLTASV